MSAALPAGHVYEGPHARHAVTATDPNTGLYLPVMHATGSEAPAALQYPLGVVVHAASPDVGA